LDILKMISGLIIIGFVALVIWLLWQVAKQGSDDPWDGGQ